VRLWNTPTKTSERRHHYYPKKQFGFLHYWEIGMKDTTAMQERAGMESRTQYKTNFGELAVLLRQTQE